MSEKTRLNLGSAWSKYEGFTNIDLRKTPLVDKIGDIRNLQTIGYEKESVDEIISYHSLEHQPYYHIKETLKNWYETLTPGGKITIATPDLEYEIQRIETDWEKANQYIFGEFTPNGYWGMEQDWHRSAFTEKSLTKLLTEIGFKKIVKKEREYPEPEICLEAYK